jgi:pyruvyl transferase EpsO
VLRDFPTVRTVQLAQSIWFEQAENLDHFADLVRSHRDLTLLLRDERSLEVARRHFTAASQLCPDMALGLGSLSRPGRPSRPIVWLRRSDCEAATEEARSGADDDIEPVDWLSASPAEAVGGRTGAWLMSANRRLSALVHRWPALWRPLGLTYAPLARRRLDFGCRLLASGRVVISDRLHGVVLALLLGLPVVALDNRNHKVSSFISTWLSDVPSVCLVATPDEALAAARRFLDAGRWA